MHSTFLVIYENPVTSSYTFKEEELPEQMMYGRGYDYWGESDLESEVEDCLSGYYAEFFKPERIEIEEEGYPDDVIVQFKITISNREKFMRKLYKEYRKAVDELSNMLTPERLSDNKDRELDMSLYRVRCVLEDETGTQFYSEYALFESPEELMRRSKDGDTYYIIAAYDYHY